MNSVKRDVRGWTLGLASIWDMRAKLAWEVRSFRHLARNPVATGPDFRTGDDQGMLFAAANAFSTAWHLTDWLAFHADADDLWGAISKVAGRPVADRKKLKEWILTIDPMRLCFAICVATKHVGVSDPALRDMNLEVPVFFDFHVPKSVAAGPVYAVRNVYLTTESGGVNFTQTVANALGDLELWWDWFLHEAAVPQYPPFVN
ncbi:hypothetical protein [Stenotrophomonas maltophilia]|uniref:hypothetical protein n=1 Tax=Stenotrophomonas maltophilia TaxID=40324 RepID=UPI0034D6F08C